MIQPIGIGWVTGHLAMKHPLIALIIGSITGGLSVVYAFTPATKPTPAVEQVQQKIAVITFDDGNRSDVDIAAPILYEHGFVATSYVATKRHSAITPQYVADMFPWGHPDLTERQKKTLVDMYGWEIGHHTITHPDLTKLTPEEVAVEIALPIDNGTIKSFSSPYGEFTTEILEAVKRQGYTSHVRARDNEDRPNMIPLADPFLIERFVYVQGSDLDALCLKERDPKNALVVAFHMVVETGGTQWTIDAATLDRFIRCLRENNYRSVTISDLVEMK